VVHEEKIFKDLSKFPLFCSLNGHDLNKSESPLPRDLSTKFGSNQTSGFGEEVV